MRIRGLVDDILIAMSTIVVTLCLMSQKAVGGELALASTLTQELDLILRAGDGLHKALITQSDEQIDLSLRDMIVQLDRARAASVLAKPHERRHLLRILDSAREHFELTQSTFGDERRVRLEHAFNQLVNLVRIYRLDRAYAIYFCPKDKTTWVQRGSKAQNPFRVEHQRDPCGMRVPR